MTPPSPHAISQAVAELEAAIARIERVHLEAEEADISDLVLRMRQSAAVTADHPAEVKPGGLAPAKRGVKGLIRKMVRWYVERFALDVRTFNHASVHFAQTAVHRFESLEGQLGEQLGEQQTGTADLAARTEQLAAEVANLQNRVRRVREAQGAAAAPSPASSSAPAPVAGPAFDYYAFELRGRGAPETIRARQADYVPLFADAADVLDVGCGRGEFLELMRDAGVSATGIDSNRDMVDHCTELGLEVVHGDGLAHLAAHETGSLGGVFAAQVVEHLDPQQLTTMLEHALRVLRPGSPLVLETINPNSLVALRHYFADLTHVQPLVPETLHFLVQSAGFHEATIQYRSPFDYEALLHAPPRDDLPEATAAAFERNVGILNAILFAPQDFAVIARA